MKQDWLTPKKIIAAGVRILPAAILMTACNTATPPPQPVAATSIPTQTASPTASPTPTPLPPTFTATPLPSPTHTSTATVTPSPTPPSTPSPTPVPLEMAAKVLGAQAYTTTLTLSTYPIKEYLTEKIDGVYNIPVYYFDRVRFEAAQPAPAPVDYTGVVLENPYLRLTFLPELGGRLYSAVVKSTGQEIFYHNPVVKPSRYGALPYQANWWLAAGGMEWAYPVQEHGYRWGIPWTYTVTQTANAATITLSDTGPERVGATVHVTLPANSAAFTIKPTLTNATDNSVPVQFWLNASLALAPSSMSLNTNFIVPTDTVTIHSRGEEGWDIPAAQEESPWPQVGATDLSHYNQWADYLGFFMPHLNAPFMGAYNPDSNLGVVRLTDPGTVPGHKVFAFGPPFLDRSYTDDESQYFELWGGANTGFWPEHDVTVAAGDTLQWQESWWPLAGLGGITWATKDAAIFVSQAKADYNTSANDNLDSERTLLMAVAQPQQGTVTVRAGQTPVLSEPFHANPATPLQWTFNTTQTVSILTQTVSIIIKDNNQNILLETNVSR